MTKAERFREYLGVKNREVFVVCAVGWCDPDFEAFFDNDLLMTITGDSVPFATRPASGEEWTHLMLDEDYEIIPADKWDYNARCKEFEEAKK